MYYKVEIPGDFGPVVVSAFTQYMSTFRPTNDITIFFKH